MPEKTRIMQLGGNPNVAVKNKRGEWVEAIPHPFYGLKKLCGCGKSFWTEEGYQGHYALKHILYL